jgi:hypothetical protein
VLALDAAGVANDVDPVAEMQPYHFSGESSHVGRQSGWNLARPGDAAMQPRPVDRQGVHTRHFP